MINFTIESSLFALAGVDDQVVRSESQNGFVCFDAFCPYLFQWFYSNFNLLINQEYDSTPYICRDGKSKVIKHANYKLP